MTALIIAACALGQTNAPEADLARLATSLAALTDRSITQTAHLDRIAADIIAVSEENHRPSAASVGILAQSLVRSLSGKSISTAQSWVLATEIQAVLRSAGVATFRFQQALDRFEQSLRTLELTATDAKAVAAPLAAVGKEVRGPEGIPAQPLK